MKGPTLMVSGSFYQLSSSSHSQKNLNPPSPPVFMHLNIMSALSPIQHALQSRGFTNLMIGGSLLALIGTSN